MSEAVTNCIVHAYRKKGSDRSAANKILIECEIETTPEGEDGGILHIGITDYGCGIDDVERAVQPFYTTLSDDERSGMGVHHHADIHDGVFRNERERQGHEGENE